MTKIYWFSVEFSLNKKEKSRVLIEENPRNYWIQTGNRKCLF